MKEQLPAIKQGWLRALVFIIIMAGVLLVAQTLFLFIPSLAPVASENEAMSKLLNFSITYLILSVFIFGLTYLFRKFIDRKSFASLGFYWKGYQNEALLGFFTGPAILGIGTIVLVILNYLTFTGVNFDANGLLVEFLILVLVSFSEELLFRGYLLNNLLQSMNKWVALLISSILFGLFHASNPDVSILAITNVFVAGLLLGVNYIYTKNLWFGILFHFSWNFFQGPVFGYDVSGLELQSIFQQTLSGPELFTGGPFGFEGSILCPALTAMATAYFAYLFSKMYKQIVLPQQLQ
jgi:uncharacterized protein